MEPEEDGFVLDLSSNQHSELSQSLAAVLNDLTNLASEVGVDLSKVPRGL